MTCRSPLAIRSSTAAIPRRLISWAGMAFISDSFWYLFRYLNTILESIRWQSIKNLRGINPGGLHMSGLCHVTGLPLFCPFLIPQHIKRQQGHADTDAGISHVEGRPVMRFPKHIEKIDHLAQPYPVNQVADGAGENHGQGDLGQLLVVTQLSKSYQYDQRGNNRHCDEKGQAP